VKINNGYNYSIYKEDGVLANKKYIDNTQNHLQVEKRDIKEVLSQPANYVDVEIKANTYLNNFFNEIHNAFNTSFSEGMLQYESMYNEIMENNSEGKERDTLIGLLDRAFENASSFYAEITSRKMMNLSGIKLKVVIPAKGSNTHIKPDNSSFDKMLVVKEQIKDEIINLLNKHKNNFNANGSFFSFADNISSNSNSLSAADLDILNKGLLNELHEMEKSGLYSSNVIFEKINNSSLGNYAKDLLNKIITKDYL